MKRYDTDPEYRLMQIFLGKSVEKAQVIEVYIHDEDEMFVCTCPGFRMRRECKHAAWVAAQVEANDGHYIAPVMTSAHMTNRVRNDPVAFRKWLYDNGTVLMLE